MDLTLFSLQGLQVLPVGEELLYLQGMLWRLWIPFFLYYVFQIITFFLFCCCPLTHVCSWRIQFCFSFMLLTKMSNSSKELFQQFRLEESFRGHLLKWKKGVNYKAVFTVTSAELVDLMRRHDSIWCSVSCLSLLQGTEVTGGVHTTERVWVNRSALSLDFILRW